MLKTVLFIIPDMSNKVPAFNWPFLVEMGPKTSENSKQELNSPLYHFLAVATFGYVDVFRPFGRMESLLNSC